MLEVGTAGIIAEVVMIGELTTDASDLLVMVHFQMSVTELHS